MRDGMKISTFRIDDIDVGVILYAGELTLPFGERLWAVPLQALWTN